MLKPANPLPKPEVRADLPKLKPILRPIEFKRAERAISSLLVGLCGPAGSGKTMSALRLATGLAMGKPILFIDTETGRGLQYAPAGNEPASPPSSFDFFHHNIEPPFTPQRFKNVVVAAAKLRPGAIIIDSMTHEWMGLGGMLDMVDDAGGNFRSWKEPKKAHVGFMNRVTTTPCHFIICMRAKEKFIQTKIGGKWEVVNDGWHSVAETGLPYDMTVNLLLKGGVPQDAFDEFKLPENMKHLINLRKPLDEEAGRKLAEWCAPPKEWPKDALEEGLETETTTEDN